MSLSDRWRCRGCDFQRCIQHSPRHPVHTNSLHECDIPCPLPVLQKIGREPLRIILDSKLRIPENSQVLRDSNVLIATTSRASKNKKASLQKRGIEVVTFTGKTISLKKLLSVLREKGIISIFVEGGGKVLGSFIDAKIVDRVYAFYAPVIIGGEKAITIGGRGADKVKNALRLQNISTRRFGDNFLITGIRLWFLCSFRE